MMNKYEKKQEPVRREGKSTIDKWSYMKKQMHVYKHSYNEVPPHSPNLPSLTYPPKEMKNWSYSIRSLISYSVW